MNPGTFTNRIRSLVNFLEASTSSSEEAPSLGERLDSLPWAPAPPSCGAAPGAVTAPHLVRVGTPSDVTSIGASGGTRMRRSVSVT